MAGSTVSVDELAVVDADASEEALECVGAAGRDCDLRHVAFASVPRQRQRLVRDDVLRALLLDVDLQLPAPLADLDDDRHVVVDGDVASETRRSRPSGHWRAD